jgi:tetratricopeptide (TPR) repeat protein
MMTRQSGRFRALCFVCVTAMGQLGPGVMLYAEEGAKVEKIEWAGSDIRGAAVKVPASDRVTILVFLMEGQAQSKEAALQVKKLLAGAGSVQAIAIVRGQDAETRAKELARSGQWTLPAVADSDYGVSGKMSVHVWPTTVVVRPNGEVVAHMGGLSPSFAHVLELYVQAGQGKLDPAGLTKRLASDEVVSDTPHQKAARHQQLGQRLLEKGQIDQARSEFADGLKLEPGEKVLQMGMTRALLMAGQPEQALAMLKGIDAASLPPWQTQALRGWALYELGKWDEARGALLEGVKLNPQPAEAYYLLGSVYLHQKDFEHAAECFRHAFESTSAGKQISQVQAGSNR